MTTLKCTALVVFLALAVAACGDATEDTSTGVEDPPDDIAVEPTADPTVEPPADPVVEIEDPQENVDGIDPTSEDEFPEYRYDDPAQYYHVEYVEPDLGGVAEIREGAIVRGTPDAYVVTYSGCCKGDTLYVNITSLEDNAVFSLYGPGGAELATEAMSAVWVLEEDGEYWIAIGSTRGNAAYTVETGLAEDAS